MNALTDLVVSLIARMRRRPPSRWVVRVLLASCGLLCQAWISATGGVQLWTTIGVVAVVVGVVLPRTVMPLVAGIVMTVQVAIAPMPSIALIPVAVLLLGWHACATLLSIGRPWARLGPRVVAGSRLPVLTGLAAIVATAGAAVIAEGMDAGEAGILTLAAAFVVVAGVIVALWPDSSSRSERAAGD